MGVKIKVNKDKSFSVLTTGNEKQLWGLCAVMGLRAKLKIARDNRLALVLTEQDHRILEEMIQAFFEDCFENLDGMNGITIEREEDE